MPKRILVCTDAWRPQLNGVVRTYERLAREVRAFGTELVFLSPSGFPTVPAPTYPEIRLALVTPGQVARRIASLAPDAIHIATEGPIGLAARRACRRLGRPFTTTYHTRFPEYLAARFPVRAAWGYRFQRWFHNGGAGMMVSAPSLADELAQRGFRNILAWRRGVDTTLFRPRDRAERLFGNERPVFLYVGRVAVEKNLEAFLGLDLPGRKVVVGDGPARARLAQRYPECRFTGAQEGEALARAYASADVFVFPSLTDTFANVLLEAMASGLPVAAYPVTGPKDLVIDGRTGALDEDLGKAALRALALTDGRRAARRHAEGFSWAASAESFLANIARANGRL